MWINGDLELDSFGGSPRIMGSYGWSGNGKGLISCGKVTGRKSIVLGMLQLRLVILRCVRVDDSKTSVVVRDDRQIVERFCSALT